MTPAEATARRLLGAIEEFAEQEILALRAGDSQRARDIQGRATPVIRRLSLSEADRASWWTPALGCRLDTILTKLRESRAFVAASLEKLHAERGRLSEARRRLHSVAPTYAHSGNCGRPSPRLNAAV